MRAVQFELDNIARAASIVPMRNSEVFFGLVTHIDRTRTQLNQRLRADAEQLTVKWRPAPNAVDLSQASPSEQPDRGAVVVGERPAAHTPRPT
jgi:hypothetical protein